MGQAQRQGQQHWAKNRDYRDLWRDEGTATARGAQRCYCAAGSPSSFMSSRRGVPSRTLDDRSPTTFLHGGRRVPFTDKTLTCADCGTPFTFSADDQAYHQERGFTNEPRRCQSCRAAKRVERGGGSSYSGSGGSSYSVAATVASARCSARHAASAARKRKCPSSHVATSRSTAPIVSVASALAATITAAPAAVVAEEAMTAGTSHSENSRPGTFTLGHGQAAYRKVSRKAELRPVVAIADEGRASQATSVSAR